MDRHTTFRCAAILGSVEAVNIQEDAEGSDEIYIRIGGVRHPIAGDPLSFEPGQRRSGFDFGTAAVFSDDFADELPVKLIEDDGIANDVWLPFVKTAVPCPDDLVEPATVPLTFKIRNDVLYLVNFQLVPVA